MPHAKWMICEWSVTAFSFFFLQVRKIKTTARITESKRHRISLVGIVLFVAQKETLKKVKSSLDEDGFGRRKRWRSRRLWKSRQGTVSHWSATAWHFPLIWLKIYFFHFQKKDKKFRMSLLSRRGSKVNEAMQNNGFTALIVCAYSSVMAVIFFFFFFNFVG